MTDDESFFRQLNSHLSIRPPPPLPLHQSKDWEFGRHLCPHVYQRSRDTVPIFNFHSATNNLAIPERSKTIYFKSPGISLRSVDKASLKYFIRILRNAIIDLLI